MASGGGVKENIIRKGAELVHARGYTATGLQDILAGAGVPKGSFYFYFKSKEDFGIELIDYYAGFISGIFTRYLRDDKISPLKRIDNLLGFYMSFFRKSGYRLGCPIGNLSLELGDAGNRFHEKLNDAIEGLIAHLEFCLDEAKTAGEIPDSMDTKSAAWFIFHGFEGAIMHMKAAKSAEPLRVFKSCIFGYLQPPRVQTRIK